MAYNPQNPNGQATMAASSPVVLASDDPAVAALQVMDDWDESDRAKVNPIVGQAGITGGSGAVAANTPRVTHASDDPVTTAMQIIDDWDESDRAKVNPIVGQAGVAAGIGVPGANTLRVVAAELDISTPGNTVKKYYTNAGAVTDGIVWSPAAGKRWHIRSLYIQVSAAATVTLEDDKGAGDDPVFKSEFAANSGAFLVFPAEAPLCSAEDAADLLVTTSAGNIYITITGYEV